LRIKVFRHFLYIIIITKEFIPIEFLVSLNNLIKKLLYSYYNII